MEVNAAGLTPRKIAVRILVIAGWGAILAACVYLFREEGSLESLASRERQFRAFQAERPVVAYSVAFLVYVLVAGLSLPPGSGVLSILYGWLFGFWPALVLVSFSATAGAAIAFLLSRFLFRRAFQARFAKRLEAFNRELEREGALYLLTLRMTPAVPFWVVNLVMGLTPISLTTFWWVSQLGMLPISVVFVWVGASAPSIEAVVNRQEPIVSPALVIALAASGVLPLLTRWIVRWVKRRSQGHLPSATDGTML